MQDANCAKCNGITTFFEHVGRMPSQGQYERRSLPLPFPVEDTNNYSRSLEAQLDWLGDWSTFFAPDSDGLAGISSP
jgi:hypothetical protein